MSEEDEPSTAEGNGTDGADYALVAEHMDLAFYRNQLSPAESEEDPVAHFLRIGWKTGLDPSPGFSVRFYLERSPDVREAGTNPFLHYLRWGRDEGRAGNPAQAGPRGSEEETDPDLALLRQNFDAEHYIAQYPLVAECHVDPVLHYHLHGWKADRDPSPRFATDFYLERNADVRASGIDPFLHYLKWGRHEGRRPHPEAASWRYLRYRAEDRRRKKTVAALFDAEFYRERQPWLRDTDIDPALHYLTFGWRQDYDPSPRFSTAFYRRFHPAETFELEDPLTDYVRRGRRLGSIPTACHPVLSVADAAARLEIQERLLEDHFDAVFYAAAAPDLQAPKSELLRDYIGTGWREGRDPAPWFSTAYYREQYPRFEAYGLDPLSHYLVWGRAQGFRTLPGLPAAVPPPPEVASAAASETGDGGMLARAVAPPPASDIAPAGQYDPETLDIHWVIPNFGTGSGGYMTIFRLIHWLESFGHRCTIWINARDPVDTDRAYDDILKHYQFVKAELREMSDALFSRRGDILVATFWDTAFLVSQAKGFKERCYLVQDYEPFFYPHGSRSLLAEQTYGLDLACLCAGPWLRQMLEERHGAWARDFRLACDHTYYFPPTAPRPAAKAGVPRIAFYGRGETDRRCTELARIAFETLAREGVAFHVDIFGSHEMPECSFPATFHGILAPEELGDLYRRADLGICFSATNYSLVPQEMMACGLPVVELDVESTRAALPEGVAHLAPPRPDGIAAAIRALLDDPEARAAQARRGQDWATGHSWDRAARDVERALLDRLETGGWRQARRPAAPAIPSGQRMKASVIVPTLNGGAVFEELLDRLAGQRADWPFELIVMDSGSKDGTVAAARARPFARVTEIPQQEFQHGRTRNAGAALAEGDFLLFLTQDALPADAGWMYNFVSAMEKYPEAAGAFGRHLAHQGASAFTRRDLRRFFAGFDRYPLLVSKHTDIRGWNARTADFLRFLHFYSDNNSCMRRSYWERMPYPEVDYGEDQLWAWRSAARGWHKLYCPNAVVRHSHEAGYAETLERAETEARFFRRHFGYDLSVADMARAIAERHADTDRVALLHGIPEREAERRKQQQVAQLLGWGLGRWRGADPEEAG